MTRRIFLLVSALAACGGPAPELPPFASTGGLAGFTPLVPYSTVVAECEDLSPPPERVGTEAFGFVYRVPPRPAEQRVVVTLDGNGEPVRYSDIRGDLVLSDEVEGDQTMILINFQDSTALLRNRPQEGTPREVRVRLVDAVESEMLGHPRQRINDILEACGPAS